MCLSNSKIQANQQTHKDFSWLGQFFRAPTARKNLCVSDTLQKEVPPQREMRVQESREKTATRDLNNKLGLGTPGRGSLQGSPMGPPDLWGTPADPGHPRVPPPDKMATSAAAKKINRGAWAWLYYPIGQRANQTVVRRRNATRTRREESKTSKDHDSE